LSGEAFEKELVLTLRPGDIVILDNLGSTPRQGRATDHSRRWRQAVLPAEIFPRPEPDRTALHQAQEPLAQGRPRTADAVCHAIAQILEIITPQECRNYFANAGYNQR
jgi:transposase